MFNGQNIVREIKQQANMGFPIQSINSSLYTMDKFIAINGWRGWL